MSDLAAIQNRVEAMLNDNTNLRYDTTLLTAAIRRGLAEISQRLPQLKSTTISSTADTREYSLSTITDLSVLIEVWYPFNSTTPQHPPNRVRWYWLGTSIYLDVTTPPSGAADDKIRLIYAAPHTLEDLDGAASTTLDAAEEIALVLTAAGYAGLAIANSSINTPSANGWTPRQYQEWAAEQFKLARESIRALEQDRAASVDTRIPWFGASRQDGAGGPI